MPQCRTKITELQSCLPIVDDGYVEELTENLRTFKAVLGAHRISLWEYDIKTGKCHFPDEYFQILELDEAGIHFQDLAGLLQYIHPDDQHLVSMDFFKSKIENMDYSSSVVNVRCIGPQGKVVWLEDHFFSIQKDEEGNPEKLISYTVNVTMQHQKEAHILTLEARNRKIIEALPEFIFIFDDDFFITDVLMASNTILLHPIDVLKGANGRTIYSPEVSDLFIENIRECLKDGLLKEIEYPLDVENEERHYFQARIAPFEENKVLALIHDIGDRVHRSEELIEAKRRAEEADRMKSVFLANMSHEIRTPLNAIVGFSEILAVTDDPIEKEEYTNIIQKNSNLLLQLINDILDLSRIESGKSEMHLQPTEMLALVEEVEKVHRLKMKEGVVLKMECPAREIWTSTDRNRVTQVLFNFLSNAIKNTEKGSITLGLREENGWLKLYVSDTGCGIAEDKLPVIFGRFEKLNDFVQGTGLGLSICQNIVQRLGGRIEVKSKLGEGTTFAFYLPYCMAGQASGEITIDDADENSRKKHKRILLAEDVETNFLQISAFLKKDYTISWVQNGAEAVSSFMRERPDLILMDIRMPVMNGIEAIEKIRSMSIDIPIIAVTAHAFYTEQQQALVAGCNDILSKPYSMERLREIVEKYI